MKKNVYKTIILRLFVCILFICLFSILFSIKTYDNDLFFDIKTGETILKYGIDFKDHFSFIPNLTYLYHHWLYDLIIYFINTYFGFLGLKLFFLSIFFIFGIVYFTACNKIINNKLLSLFITIFTMYYSKIFFTTRVQSITYILFFIEVLLLNKIYSSNKKRYLIYLTILCILIVNLHMPLWIFSLVLYLPYLYSALVSLIFNKNNDKYFNSIIDKPISYKNLFLSFFIIILSGIISPYGIKVYTFFIKYLTSEGYSYFNISELHFASLINFRFELLLIILLILGLYLNRLKMYFKDLLMLIGLFVFSLLSIRNVIYFYIIGMYILLKNFSGIKLEFKRKIIINYNILCLTIIPFLIITIGYTLYTIDYPNNDYKIKEEYPVEIVEYMKENLNVDEIRLYNHFNFGSYIEYKDIPVFVDSRAEVYIDDFNGGYNIAKDYYESIEIDKYESVFKKYQFNYALLYIDNDLNKYLKYNTYFKKIKSDDYFILYSIDDDMYNK